MKWLHPAFAIAAFLAFSVLQADNKTEITVYRMTEIQRAFLAHFHERGYFPMNTTGVIEESLNAAQSRFIEPLSSADGWGNKLNYSSPPPSHSYRLISFGPNGKLDSNFSDSKDSAAILNLDDQKYEAPSTAVPLTDLLRYWADVSGNNIIFDRFYLQGDVVLTSDKQSWTDALSRILSDCGLGVAKYGDVVWIAPAEKTKYLQELPKKQYFGEPFSFDFMNIDLYDLLRFLGDVGKLNASIDPSIKHKGYVKMKLSELPWDEALDIVSFYYGLKYTITGNVLRIEPLKAGNSSPLTRAYDDILLIQQDWGYCLVKPDLQ